MAKRAGGGRDRARAVAIGQASVPAMTAAAAKRQSAWTSLPSKGRRRRRASAKTAAAKPAPWPVPKAKARRSGFGARRSAAPGGGLGSQASMVAAARRSAAMLPA